MIIKDKFKLIDFILINNIKIDKSKNNMVINNNKLILGLFSLLKWLIFRVFYQNTFMINKNANLIKSSR